MDDPTDFNTTELQTLDEHLRCSICKEFYDTAMILSTCSHTFCALCIRRSLATEQCCPTCRMPSHDSKLHNNYALDHVIQAWKNSRLKLLDLEKGTMVIPAHDTTTATIMTTTREIDSSATPSQRRSSRLRTEEDPNLVACPVCQQKMDMTVLNQHVDRCLEGDSRIPPMPIMATPVQKKVNTGKKPIKIVYDMHKEKDLRRTLKNLDLPDHGDRTQLIWRHKEYVTLYNANMDSPDPMDIKQVIRQLQSAETLHLTNKTTLKRSSPDVMAQQKYDDEYKALIEKVRKKPKQHNSLISSSDSEDHVVISPSDNVAQ